MREMGFQIARKHAQKLRAIAMLLLFCAPAIGLVVILAVPSQTLAIPVAALAVVSAGVGVATERWLFFAEATHTSMIYYNGRP